VSTPDASRALPRLQLALTAALFSTGGAAIKACALDAWRVACFRSGIAALTILVLVPAARRWSRATLAVGVVYAATLVAFVAANKHTTAANAIFLQSTAPLYVVLLGPWLLGERVRAADLAFLAALGLGLWLLLAGRAPASATAPEPVLGDALGALCGLLWALTLIGLRRVSAHGPGASIAAAAAGNALAFAGCLAFALPPGGGARDWAVLAYLGVVQIGIAYVLLGAALRRVPVFEAALLLMLEPALSPLWAWWLFGERPGSGALAGGALILGAGLGKTLWALRAGR
jgi:drug/metabolite transporter (DMT)-like permease